MRKFIKRDKSVTNAFSADDFYGGDSSWNDPRHEPSPYDDDDEYTDNFSYEMNYLSSIGYWPPP